ncbi:MAG TPA: hypothetical protein VF530_01050 [Planctomycetota bacterium]
MDTLALLCNLHADGPATLQRLRRSGCESLGALRRLDAARLAQTLAWSERAAERFLREAALLHERVDGSGVEGELEPALEEAEVGQALAAGEPDLEDSLLEELDGEDAASEAESEEPLAAEHEEDADRAPAAPAAPAAPERLRAVLGAWRELDRVAPPGDPAAFVIPRPPSPPDLELGRARLAALTPALAARLAELGVHSLRQLLERRELELARALPLPYTRLRHLCHQAERALEGLAESALPAAAPAAFRAFTPPPSEPFETAGPFA